MGRKQYTGGRMKAIDIIVEELKKCSSAITGAGGDIARAKETK